MLKRRILKFTMVLITIIGSVGGLGTLAAGSALAATQPTALPGLHLVPVHSATPSAVTYFQIENGVNHHFCLDANINGGIGNGDNVQIWQCNGRSNQQWGWVGHQLVNQANFNFCLDANINGGIGNGDNVQIWQCNRRSNQPWFSVPDVSSQVELSNGAGPSFVLDARVNGGIKSGDNVQIWQFNNQNNQAWIL